MSSDTYFDDVEQMDSAFFDALDAIEATHTTHTTCAPHKSPLSMRPALGVSNPSSLIALPTILGPNLVSAEHDTTERHLPAAHPFKAAQPEPIDVDADDSYDQFMEELDSAELEAIDEAAQKASKPISGGRPLQASGSSFTRQLDLFGRVVEDPHPRVPRPQTDPKPFGKKAQKVKKWDHTAFAKSGWTKAKMKPRTKDKPDTEDIQDDSQSADEFEQFPAPPPDKFACGHPPPFKHKPDLLAAQTWIYPTNKPKRDYQFNIVRDSLFENSLVALPTGLGKTFIAGVIMLNYYRWFPEGKVVFVAPTKPLVAQQIDACHQICGIPGGDAAELTGQINRQNRAKSWQEKRVFFMTPQTFMNDLKRNDCNPTDIVLLVIGRSSSALSGTQLTGSLTDEAHKATGDHSYAQLVRYLMATCGHFRVLALTATPGSKPEAVQAIIDSLHISNIEIRDENSLDLRDYILPKKISTHIIKMNPEITKVRDMLVKLMAKSAKRLFETGLMPNIDFVKLHPYRCTKLIQDSSVNGNGKKFPWLFSTLKILSVLARAMGYLLECSTQMCYDELHGLLSGTDRDGKKVANLRTEPLLLDIIKELEQQHNAGKNIHPKMEKLELLALDYFAQTNVGAENAVQHPPLGGVEMASGQSKMMVFTNFRLTVEEIVAVLNKHSPIIRATRFIGQGTDKHGKKGIAQKDQLEVIKKFKNGDYNTLVATSIGEEGLDIGEVDAIVCYDAQKAPIRMLQRIGRTGRRREGRVDVLMCEGREESNWDNAKSEYENVQRSILRGDSLELYADVERLLPSHIKPKCLETFMVIEEYIRDTRPPKNSASVATEGKKRKRQIGKNIPEGAMNGFIASSKLVPKSKKRKIDYPPFDPKDLESDDDDRDIKAGIHAVPPSKPDDIRLRKSTSKSSSNTRTSSAVSKARAKKTSGVATGSNPTQLIHSSSSECSAHTPPHLDLRSSSPVLTLHQQPNPKEDHSWLLDSDDDDKEKVDGDVVEDTTVSSPIIHRSPPRTSPSAQPAKPQKASGSSPPLNIHAKLLDSEDAITLSPFPVKSPQALSSIGFPEPSFPIRALKPRRKRIIALSPSTSFDIESKQPQTERIHGSPLAMINNIKHPIDPDVIKEFLDLEAEVSGDDSAGVHNSSDGDGTESESDRRFLEELDPTQVVPNYDQFNAYRHSLMTQPPARHNVPSFTSNPTRRSAFGPMRQVNLIGVSSSPPREMSDRYSMDSFVIPDDDDVLLHNEPDSE